MNGMAGNEETVNTEEVGKSEINEKITETNFTAVEQGGIIQEISITELRKAIDRLQNYGVNVDNCGNCDFCQTCQTITCQETTCQSLTCQSYTCQGCQSCQRNCNCNCNCNCDCNCSDDGE